MGKSGFELIQELVAEGSWTPTRHAKTDRLEWDWTDEDIGCCVARGELVSDDLDDEEPYAVDGRKYGIVGPDSRQQPFYVAGKVVVGGSFLVFAAHPNRV